jgi:hypothetical protein
MINEENRNLEYCASLRVKNYLETAVEFLLLPRQRGLSRVDPWLRPRPAKTDHFLAGVNNSGMHAPIQAFIPPSTVRFAPVM